MRFLLIIIAFALLQVQGNLTPENELSEELPLAESELEVLDSLKPSEEWELADVSEELEIKNLLSAEHDSAGEDDETEVANSDESLIGYRSSGGSFLRFLSRRREPKRKFTKRRRRWKWSNAKQEAKVSNDEEFISHYQDMITESSDDLHSQTSTSSESEDNLSQWLRGRFGRRNMDELDYDDEDVALADDDDDDTLISGSSRRRRGHGRGRRRRRISQQHRRRGRRDHRRDANSVRRRRRVEK